MKFKTLFLVCFCIGYCLILDAQSNECGFGEHAFSNNYKQWYQQAVDEANAPESSKRNLSKFDTIYTVKVIFHLIYPTLTIISKREYISKWMNDINADFNRENADSFYLRSMFRSRVGNAKIRFVLADKDPDGNPCQGYTFTKSDKYFGVLPGTPFSKWHNMKFDSLGGKNAWNTNEYLNIWVCDNMAPDMKYYYGAFATPPNKASFWSPTYWPDSAIDGIVMGNFTYESNYRSTTLTHEIGHYLGLRHVSGDAVVQDSTCKYDDFIFDTPKIFAQNYNCDYHLNSCQDSINDMPDMLENFMDYSSCRNTFTKGQVNVMRYSLTTLRKGLASPSFKKIFTDYQFRIYPTLTENKVLIDFDEDVYEDIKIHLYDFQGRLLHTQSFSKSDYVDLSLYNSGTYFIKVFTGVAMLNEPVIIMKY